MGSCLIAQRRILRSSVAKALLRMTGGVVRREGAACNAGEKLLEVVEVYG
ncbi:MAG TPA: hypothetical protein VNM92_02360 [Thermoanaerobaculia bacterium]|nr:hypothetical protein [Thermoanaerobaculia bacterium]